MIEMPRAGLKRISLRRDIGTLRANGEINTILEINSGFWVEAMRVAPPEIEFPMRITDFNSS